MEPEITPVKLLDRKRNVFFTTMMSTRNTRDAVDT